MSKDSMNGIKAILARMAEQDKIAAERHAAQLRQMAEQEKIAAERHAAQLRQMAEQEKIAAEERRLDAERWRLLIERLDERHEEARACSDAHMRALVAILDSIGGNGPGAIGAAKSSR